MANEKIVRVGIIGQGRSGRNIHGKLLETLSEKFKITAVVDGLENRRVSAAADFGCDVYATHEELFARQDLDLIVNATPSHLHVPVSLDFLQHGFNVLCEKPLASSTAEVDQLIAAAKQSGKLLSVFQQSRYASAFVQVKKVIDSGVLGRVVRASVASNKFARRWDWQTLKKFNGGNLMNTGPHPMDQALQLFGTDFMPNVTCVMDSANSFGDAEDYVHVLLRGEGRPVVDVEISSCTPYSNFDYQIQGTNGGLKGTVTHLEWKYFKPEEAPEQHLIAEPLFNADGSPAYCREKLTWYEESWDKSAETLRDSMGAIFYNMLHNALTTGAPLEITPEQVRQQIAVAEECFRQNPRFAR